MKTYSIYIMKDECGNTFYVGKTNEPNKRFHRHLYHVKYGSQYPVHNKLRKVISIKGNSNGIYEVIESGILEEDIDSREMYYIKMYRDAGCRLKNLTDGGEGGKGFTPEINKRGALKRTGKPRSQQTRDRISKSKTGVKFSDTHKQALKKAWKTRPSLSREHYQKISVMNRGTVNIKKYMVMSPSGETFITEHGLTDFCRERGLSNQNLHKTLNGSRKHHKGWRILHEL